MYISDYMALNDLGNNIGNKRLLLYLFRPR